MKSTMRLLSMAALALAGAIMTTAPALPAKTLQPYCYQFMFWECTKLNSVTCLATNISAGDCTKNWLNGVAASGTFTTPSSTNWPTKSPDGIPNGWTRVDYVAPTE